MDNQVHEIEQEKDGEKKGADKLDVEVRGGSPIPER